MEIKKLAVGPLSTNCYLAWCPETKEAVAVDPGYEAETILKAIRTLGLQVKYIINTHGHVDHIGANEALVMALDCPIAIGSEDAPMLTSASKNLSRQVGQPLASPDAQILLSQGDIVKFGSCTLEVLDTPGHTRGGISLYSPGTLFAGDTLFKRSVGRTDLPGGNQEQLMESIRTRLLILPDETRVLPGHGPESTIGSEKKNNPWLKG